MKTHGSSPLRRQLKEVARRSRRMSVPPRTRAPDESASHRRRRSNEWPREAALALETLGAGAEAIDAFAEDIGLLFQITDDLLDISQTSEVLGKTAGKDAVARKMTYPSKFGYDRAVEIAGDVRRRASNALEPLGPKAGMLREISTYIFNRVN